MSAIDRRIGVYGNAAIKLPCRVATTAAITADGLQTIDGVALAAGDRVLRKNETNAVLNGIWVADTGEWQRASDFNGARDCVKGTLIYITDGNAGGDTVYRLTTADPVIGTSLLTFSEAGAAALNLASSFGLDWITQDDFASATGFFDVKKAPFNATGDGQRIYGATIAQNSKALTCALYDGWSGFTSADVGKTIMLSDVGLGFATQVNTIAAYVSPTQVTLTDNALNTFASGAGISGTSTTSRSIGSGSKTFATQSSKSWVVGASLKFTSAGTPGVLMYGRVTSYSGTSLVVDIVSYVGTGTYTDWVIEGYSADVVYGTDDTEAMQLAALTATSVGGRLVIPQGIYLISEPVTFAIDQGLTNNIILGTFSDEYDYLRNLRKVEVIGEGNAQIIATAAMDQMFLFTFSATVDPATNNPAPWSSELRNVALNGSDLAESCVKTDSMREMRIRDCTITNAENGIYFSGVYGGHTVENNKIMACLVCILDENGDHDIVSNSLAPYNAVIGSTAYAYFTEGGFQGAGNTSFVKNTVQTVVGPHVGSTILYGFYVDGTVGASETFRDITVEDNEFQGLDSGVIVLGDTGGLNTLNVRILNNHVIVHANGVTNRGKIAQIQYVNNFVIAGNQVGDLGNLTTAAGLVIDHCVLGVVSNNTFRNTNGTPIACDYVEAVTFIGNVFLNVGQSSTGNQCILLSHTSLRNIVVGNKAQQDSGTYAQSLVAEVDGSPNHNVVLENVIFGMANLYVFVGANSWSSRSGNGTLPRTFPLTVATLPAAADAGAGARAYVTDSNATLAAGLGNTVAGGGSNKTPVFSDGTNWKIG